MCLPTPGRARRGAPRSGAISPRPRTVHFGQGRVREALAQTGPACGRYRLRACSAQPTIAQHQPARIAQEPGRVQGLGMRRRRRAGAPSMVSMRSILPRRALATAERRGLDRNVALRSPQGIVTSRRAPGRGRGRSHHTPAPPGPGQRVATRRRRPRRVRWARAEPAVGVGWIHGRGPTAPSSLPRWRILAQRSTAPGNANCAPPRPFDEVAAPHLARLLHGAQTGYTAENPPGRARWPRPLA